MPESAVRPGARLGPYEIVSRLGAGGMGEVWQAKDTRLERSVAIKVLPPAFAGDAAVRARFEREAKTISQLNHPSICTLFDVGREGEIDYLVMELIVGESLADRLEKGPLPLSEVLKIGSEIAAALDRAHRAGIVHRDLKPGNVMLTKSGSKLLDFGLAKGVTPVFSVSSSTLDEPTQHKPLTQEGTIVGTFQYMAPEQLEGVEADARTDIFALGAVLYEMATGKRAFSGRTKTSLIVSILEHDPEPISSVMKVAPPAFEHIVRKCLAKDPEDRWQSARDVAGQLAWIAGAGSQAGAAPVVTVRRRVRERLAWSVAAVAALAALGAIVFLAMGMRVPLRPVVYSSITAPDGVTFDFENGSPVISPDGAKIAFAGRDKDGKQRIWIRRLDAPNAVALNGTDDAAFPFWSPDSNWIGFFAGGKLKKIRADGDGLESLADATAGRGGAWNAEGVIVFSRSQTEGLFRVSAGGGIVSPLTSIESKPASTSHRWPSFTGDGRHFAFYLQGVSDVPNVQLASLDGGASVPLLNADAGVRFAGDMLIYIRDRSLRAQRVDLRIGKMVGDATTIAEGVQVSTVFNLGMFSASANGTLIYASGEEQQTATLKLLDRSGKELQTLGVPGNYYDPRVSHDGKTISLAINDNGGSDVWTFEIARSVSSRLTFSPAGEYGGSWSPDDKYVAYTSFDHSPGGIRMKHADGSGSEETVLENGRRNIVSDWSNDGRYLMFHTQAPGNGWDLSAWSFQEQKAIPLVSTRFAEYGGVFSPDARWFAYASDESGKVEVYVQRMFASSGKWQISNAGGASPVWSRDGKEIFYRAADGKMMAVTVRADATFTAETPRPLFSALLRSYSGLTRRQYDVTPEGRFVVNEPAAVKEAPRPLTIVQNWAGKLPKPEK